MVKTLKVSERAKKKIMSNGYVLLYMPDYSNSSIRGYVYEHRYLIEQKIGRFLDSEEQVHHLNGVRDDNRIDNLVLCKNRKEHVQKYHPEIYLRYYMLELRNSTKQQSYDYWLEKYGTAINKLCGYYFKKDGTGKIEFDDLHQEALIKLRELQDMGIKYYMRKYIIKCIKNHLAKYIKKEMRDPCITAVNIGATDEDFVSNLGEYL